ncbi:MAG TPA: substrate-binding domain-containing protein [Vicinamibacterales bacterium]|nr:substrate-binding domain-containing protein [Vicinamibacterales bacterium]HOQ61142.1 substrate-binding domain-containing protein [Vicinamibacterales bacterium]HPK71611.1 substrate-binding domain-containing protein [Vicinamibacterales bacterium]
MSQPLSALLVITLLAVTAAPEAQREDLQAYEPTVRVSGTIRAWGNDRMKPLMALWEAGFKRHHPAARFETSLMGTGTGIAGLYTGVADIALMGRPADSTETMAFEWVFRYRPLGVQVSTGSLGVPGKSFAPVVFVHKDNPISQLTLAQLDAVFGSEHRRGQANARTWGDLGLGGSWAARPIRVYAPDIQTATGSFFREAVLKGSYKWNCDMTEFHDVRRPDGSSHDGRQRVLDALAGEPGGIGLSALAYAGAAVKPLALSAGNEGPFYAPTPENLAARRYPLHRATWIFLNRPPGRPLDPAIREFLRYILSRDGQRDVERAGDYLPLTASVVRSQLGLLE